MTDPFSVSAGVVGVVSLGLTLGQGFLRYYTPWRDYDDEFEGLLQGLMAFYTPYAFWITFCYLKTNCSFLLMSIASWCPAI
jgi:hypothetical protein